MLGRRQFIWAAIALGVLAVSVFGDSGFRRSFRLRREVDDVRAHNAALRVDNERVRRQVVALKEDPAAIDRAAREELGVIREGELVFVLGGK